MEPKSKYEEAIKAVEAAESAVYEAQSNANPEQRQEAFLQLQTARILVKEAQETIDQSEQESYHRLEQALLQLHHLEEAHQSLRN